MRPSLLRSTAVAVLAGVALAVFPHAPAFACDCPEPPPPLSERDRVDGVFAGEVTEVVQHGDGPPGPWLEARIEVREVWRGDVAEVVYVRTHAETATCGYPFEEGREELVYATLDDEGHWTTGLCARTAPVEDADDDLAALGEGQAPDPGEDASPGANGGVGGSWQLVVGGLVLALAFVLLGVWHRRGPRRGTPDR